MNLGPKQRLVFEILRKNFGFDPELDSVIYYHKKIKNNELKIEVLSDLLNRKNSLESSSMKNDFNVNYFEKKIFSQSGEDGIIDFIFSVIGTTNKFFVEFGVKDGRTSNTRYLFEKKGWNGLMMDKQENNSLHIKKEFVTAENINSLLEKYNVPKDFDLLSIDIDFNDYWVWKAVTNFHPCVVIIEYNSSQPSNVSKVVEYDPNGKWDKTNYFGASLLALARLGKEKGYNLVGCDNSGTNAFFVKNELIYDLIKKDVSELYRPPSYGIISNGKYVGHPQSSREMIDV